MTDLFADIDVPPHSAHSRWAPRTRMLVLALFAAFIIVVLTGATGQQPARTSAAGPRARLTLLAPDVVRGGLLVQARFEIHAVTTIRQPRLVLQRGWLEGMQVSSIEPSPVAETGRGSDVALTFAALRGGSTRTVWMQLQVDPTSVGDRPASVELQDGSTPLARISHRLTVLP
jgi:hypothetical protein